jgi:hypothetical protein
VLTVRSAEIELKKEIDMKNLVIKYSRAIITLALFSGLVFVMPAHLQAKTRAESSVHVTVNVHGSSVGVSPEVLEETVDKLLKAAEIKVVENGGGSSVIELKIDIFKSDAKGFKVDCDWDDDPEPEAEETCDTQDEIDDIVEKEVHAFIDFIHKA